MLGGGSSSSSVRTAPTTYSTGESTRRPRLDSAKNASDRRTVSTPHATSRSWRPSSTASASISDGLTASSPKNVSQMRQARRTDVAGCATRILIRSAPDQFPRLPRIVFLAAVVCFGILGKFLILHRPARQSAGGLLDVGFGKVADAEGEELHQLASEVFVGMFPAIAGSIEPDQERWIAHGGVEQLAKALAGKGRERPHSAGASSARLLTLALLVAKWLCHMSVSRSPRGSGPKSIR